jgi:hypothetical protein
MMLGERGGSDEHLLVAEALQGREHGRVKTSAAHVLAERG